jgi:dTDP-4-amino-4,6-dideoxygalactose transaminase
MLRVGQREIDALATVIESKRLFRYSKGSLCERFEKRYAKFLGVKHVHMTSSGTTALTAALAGLGIGPGDEVIVPAHTYMATAISVLAVGAIPVIVDIDESLTMDPAALDDAVGPYTRAVIPVHMWGVACDMNMIMRIARKRNLLVIEDACQGVGGGYEGRMLGSIGHAGAFSFNFFKNMTCGEGGAVVTNDPSVSQGARCHVDCCSFYWNGRRDDVEPYAASGARASEFEGALMNVQLDRIRGLISTIRRQKKQILKATAKSGLAASPSRSLDDECGTRVLYQLPTAQAADAFAKIVGCGVAGKTGRHTYNEWDPILKMRGAHHPDMDPFRMPKNKRCRMRYSTDMCPRSLEILNRTVLVGTDPDRTPEQIKALIDKINAAAATVLGEPARQIRKLQTV